MNKNLNKILLISLFSLLLPLGILSFEDNGSNILTKGEECPHKVVNHYASKEPTLTSDGLNHEYWVCCSCHTKWTDKDYINAVSFSSLLLNKKTISNEITSYSSEDYLIQKLNNSTLKNIDEHNLYENESHNAFFIKNNSSKDVLSSFSFSSLPTSIYSISFKYKYYDLSNKIDNSSFHIYSFQNGMPTKLNFINDNLWHDYTLSISSNDDVSFNIYGFFGELYLSNITYNGNNDLNNIFSSKNNLNHYFSFDEVSLDSTNKVALFPSINQLMVNKTLIDEALINGFTHLKFSIASNSSLVNDIYLEGKSYSKVYIGNSSDVRVDLNQISKDDYSSIKVNFRDSSYNNVISDVKLSNLTFYKDNETYLWQKSNDNVYACFENDSLVIDTCFSGNEAKVFTDSGWYSKFVTNNKVNMYFFSSYLLQGDNYRGFVFGKNKNLINDIPLNEASLINQEYQNNDTFVFMLDKEGVISIKIMNESDYKVIKAKNNLNKALKEKDIFTSYFLTGDISNKTTFSNNNNVVYYSSKILGLKKELITDIYNAGYTNIAFDFKTIPNDYASNGYFDRLVYTSDGISAESGWMIVYNEFDTASLSTRFHLDIDLSKAFEYTFSSEPVINIRARRNGNESIDSEQSISNLYFYNKNNLDDIFTISFINGDNTSSLNHKINDVITLPTLEDKSNGVFKGWLYNNVLYSSGETFYVSGNMDFLAYYSDELFDLKNNDYIIVYDSNSESASWAASDLKKYINKALGVTPTLIDSDSYSYNSEDKLISIGNTPALNAINNVIIDDKLINVNTIKSSLLNKDDSFFIGTNHYGIYLYGNNGNSLRFASTKFLETKLNIKFFSSSEEYVPSLEEAKIKCGGKIYNPYFDFRTYLTEDAYSSNTQSKYDYNSHFYNDSDYASSCAIKEYNNAWIEGYYLDNNGKTTLINTAHNTYSSDDLGLVKLSTYPYETYPNMWFKDNDNIIDIHYTDGITSDGKIDHSTSAIDTASEAMYASLKTILSKIYSSISHDKEIYFSVGQADTNECCKCDACLESAFKYNNSGTMIRFYNAIINELKEDSFLKDCNFKLVMFAYQYNLFSPVVYEMNVKTSGLFSKSKTIQGYNYDKQNELDSSVIPSKEHLYVRIAPLVMDQYLGIEDDANYMLQRFNGRIYDETANKWVVSDSEYKDRLGHYKASILFSDWAKVTSNLLTWYYDTHFEYGFAAYNGSVSRLERYIDKIKENNYLGSFIQGNFKDNIYVDTLLNAYVYSYLCWDDNTLTALELRDEFIDYFFDSSSAPYIKEYYNMMDSYYEKAFKSDGFGYLDKNINRITIDNLYSAKCKLDEAYNATNDETIKGRILRLQLTPLFMLGKLDENWRVYFIDIFKKYNGKFVNESYTLDNYVW